MLVRNSWKMAKEVISLQKRNSMDRSNIIGREYEIEVMQHLFEKEDAVLMAIYGRRRVGKTFLVKCFLEDRYDFFFTGIFETPAQVQLTLFHDTLQRYSGMDLPQFKTWFQAFDALKEYLMSLKKERLVVFLDEIPWMDSPKSYFLQAFSNFWNTWASTCPGLKLIGCGSATSWMLDKFVGDKGGFYGRSNRSIYIPPFTLHETELFLKKKGVAWNRQQIAETYMIMGGIPYYLDMINPQLPLKRNIDDLFFREMAPLRQEYSFLFRSLFKDSNLYHRVVEAMAQEGKGMTQAQLKEKLKLEDGGSFSKVLDNLNKCDFIRAYQAHGKTERETMFQLTDLYTLFYLRFIKHRNGQDDHFWSNISEGKHSNWTGHAFEMLCLHHIPQIKRKLGITGVETNIFSWQTKALTDKDGTKWPGTQIDMLLERADHTINICEMKFVNTKYSIDSNYANMLQTRRETFRHHTKTSDSLHYTLITTFGVSHNENYSLVQSEVVLDNLFEK